MTREEITKTCSVYNGGKSASKDRGWLHDKACVDWLIEAQEKSSTELDGIAINEYYGKDVSIALLLMIALITFPKLPLSFRKQMPFFNGMDETDGIIGFDRLSDKEWDAQRRASSSYKKFERFVKQSRN